VGGEASAQTPPTETPSPSHFSLRSPEGLRIREIHVIARNIFDPDKPGENKALFRLADRLHRTTRPQVIERQLLLRPGDPYSAAQVAESERLLRKNRYLYDAEIRTIPVSDEEVDLLVDTRDVWSLKGGIGLRRSGGANVLHFEVQDANFLGLGKELTVSRTQNVDRTTSLFEYSDPNLRGSRARLDLAYSKNSDGKTESFTLERPFYSLDTRWALGVATNLDDRVDPLYRLGHSFEHFRHQEDFVEVYGGLSPGYSDGQTHRFRAGFTYERDRFAAASGFGTPEILPADRTLAYPWLSFEYVEDGFYKERDLDRIRRTEDVNVGREFHLRVGWSSAAFGATLDRAIVQTTGSLGWRPSPRQLLLTSFHGGSRFGGAGAENLLAGGTVRYFVRDFGDNLFVASFGYDFSHQLDAENQLLLGGDTGLRGYPLRYLEGDRRLLFSVEQRFYSDREYFHLIHAGAAVFFDIGSAWIDDTEGKVARERRLLKDVGFGLRLGPSRSSRASMVHLDVAFPLDGGSSIKRIQWLVSTSETF
jgi:outer membrane protein assembly factor BamA